MKTYREAEVTAKELAVSKGWNLVVYFLGVSNYRIAALERFSDIDFLAEALPLSIVWKNGDVEMLTGRAIKDFLKG